MFALIISYLARKCAIHTGGGVLRGGRSVFHNAGALTGTDMAGVRRPRSQVQCTIPEAGLRPRDGDDASVAGGSRSVSWE